MIFLLWVECSERKLSYAPTIRNAKEEIVQLEETLKIVDDFMRHAPEGCLKWQNKSGKTYYYQQYLEQGANESPSKWNRRYIKKKDVLLARDLAQKQYYAAMRPLLEKKIDALKKFIKNYPEEEVESIFASLSDERKRLVTPLGISAEEKIEQWNKEVYEKNSSYSENLRYETEQGDMVRSKSEVIIANILYQHRKSILYKYERPLKLIVEGRNKIIHPDFTVLNVHTGKITYWEHAGRMDDPYYANDFVRKANTYTANGLLQGRDVLFTFESQANPLEIGVVKHVVNNLCN